MTTKEVAQALNCTEEYILSLCKSKHIYYFTVIRPKSETNIITKNLRDKVVYEIDPEEVEYIDWWINGGREEYLNRVYKLVNSENLKIAREIKKKRSQEKIIEKIIDDILF